MGHTPLSSVFVGLRTGLHILFVALVVLTVVRALIVAAPSTVTVIVLCVVLLLTYGAGGILAARPIRNRTLMSRLWLLALSIEWLVLVWLIPDAAYLAFPLFFLYLHLIPGVWGGVAALGATAATIVALGVHSGWSVGGVVGPIVGAGVAIVIGLGYRSLAREAAEREQLMQELIDTRDQLAITERESGVLAERARLAREIHDTVAQGLSSIQMLLHAAERADPDQAGIAHLQLARETAAGSLADTRRFIRELAPAALVDDGLGAALRRLAETHWRSDDLEVDVRVPDSLELPMQIQAALLRITQGAMGNVLQHAQARRATISIERTADTVGLTVADDGEGFDPVAANADRAMGGSDSFGLTAIRERVNQLDGEVSIVAEPGRGTAVRVLLRLEVDA